MGGSSPTLLNWRSLRWKIALLVAVACCSIAFIVGLLVHGSTYERSMNDGAAKAYTALDNALAPSRESNGNGNGDGDDIVDVANVVYSPEEMPAELVRKVREHGQADMYDESRPYSPRMWAAERLADGSLAAISLDMTPDQLSRRALDRNMWKYSLAALAVIVPLSAFAAELPNRRLRRVARTARRIASGDLAARTETGGRMGDEIAEISATVNAMADSLQDRLLSEQRFTADVAHELRTPLMGLVTSSGLLPEGEATELVRDRVGVLRTLVEDLLEISRLDADAERADVRPVPLGEVVAESLARTGLVARLTVLGRPVAETDPRRLDRIVANLVTNAHWHGRARGRGHRGEHGDEHGGEAERVEVTVGDGIVVVRDHGPGFPESLLANGPRRFRTGAAERGRGQGLGLTIALGQAHVIGATLTFANAADDGGAVATLRLPADHARTG
ncbi:HAMP domain-containing sensor histidine kinase [Streptomyces sp. PSRA5]|uniref:HAMP domain-containing sensor histidine kinase n=1 Tax=Streptomyces panacea TaxID=3035064 RepID=UPI00339C673E